MALFRFENQSSMPIDFQYLQFGVLTTLGGPQAGNLPQTEILLAQTSHFESVPPPSLASFDGTLDFAGPSGALFTRSFEEVVERRYFAGDPLADVFVGPAGNPGTVELGTFALGTVSFELMPGLLSLAPLPLAGAEWTVTVVQDLLDCDDDGTSDAQEIASGESADLDGNQFPDSCQGNHDGDTIPDTIDPDCLGPGIDSDGDGTLDACEATADCDNDGIPDAFEVDLNHNGIDDACEFTSDCNSNGLPDALDLSVGISLDLDRNLVPDECQSSTSGFFAESLCEVQDLCPGFVDSLGTEIQLTFTGSCRLPENRFSLSAIHLPSGRVALLVGGESSTPSFELGSGLCVSSLRRLGIAITDSSGIASWFVDRPVLESAVGVNPWDRRTYQVAYRRGTPSGPLLAWSSALSLRHLP